jgi:hypothetical protein
MSFYIVTPVNAFRGGLSTARCPGLGRGRGPVPSRLPVAQSGPRGVRRSLPLDRQWKPFAILLTVTAALPVFDMSVLTLNGIAPPALHPLALVLLGAAASLLWRRVIWPVVS